MSNVQLPPNFYADFNRLVTQVERLNRIVAQIVLKDVNTSGLSSAQIDAALIGGSTNAQVPDGLMITDKTNHLLLARVSGKWGSTPLTIIN